MVWNMPLQKKNQRLVWVGVLFCLLGVQAFAEQEQSSISESILRDIPNTTHHFEKAIRVTLVGLDKVTASREELTAAVGETITLGTLEINPKVGYRTPMDEVHESAVYLVIRDAPKGQEAREIFSGWMFASSPALSPFAHPVYDLWVKECHLSNLKSAP